MPAPASFELLDPSIPLEEETRSTYKAEHYYPVKIGQVFNDRYKTITKLGYGSASTVWLCRDLGLENEHVALKVYINEPIAQRELPIYKHINSLPPSPHEGRQNVRSLLDSFDVEGPHGHHKCLVNQPLGITFGQLRDFYFSGGPLGADVTRTLLRCILDGLSFLHEEAHVIHTDLQPNNMLLGIHDESVFSELEELEIEHPVARKELDDRTICVSRRMLLTKGPPALSDLSEARSGDVENTGYIMPDVYRAPEVILGMPWSYPVDIWGFAMTLWDLFEPHKLFSGRNEDGQYSEQHHLAQMISVMGPPPVDFLRRSKESDEFWDRDGTWKGPVPIPDISLEVAEQRLQGKEKEVFLNFIRKMLRWKPEDRTNCNDTYVDEWLLADLIESGEIVRRE